MLTEDHPNALWLSELYRGGEAIRTDPSLSDRERQTRQSRHREAAIAKLHPDFVIHTGGYRLAATGGLEFMGSYAQRRAQLSGEDTVPVEIYEIVADDHYGIIYGRFQTRRGDEVWERTGMGVWRFEDALAVEHWEIGNARAWDRFYLAADSDLTDGRALEYWTRGTAQRSEHGEQQPDSEEQS